MTINTDDQPWTPASGPIINPNGNPLAGTIDFAGDTDLFRIQMQQDVGYVIRVTGAADAQLQLYTPGFFPAGAVVELPDETFVYFVADVDAVYFVEVISGGWATGAYSISAGTAFFHLGVAGADFMSGVDGADIFNSLHGNDVAMGGGGDDFIDGGAGIDTASFTGLRSNYAVQVHGDSVLTVTANAGNEGQDVLRNVERLDFSDGGRAFDLEGNAGIVARTLGAVFGAQAVSNDVYAGIGLSLVDSGTSYEALMQLALDAVLGGDATHEEVATLLYTNLVGTPSAPDLEAIVDLLENGTFTHSTLGVMAANTTLNASNIGWEALVFAGLGYM